MDFDVCSMHSAGVALILRHLPTPLFNVVPNAIARHVVCLEMSLIIYILHIGKGLSIQHDGKPFTLDFLDSEKPAICSSSIDRLIQHIQIPLLRKTPARCS